MCRGLTQHPLPNPNIWSDTSSPNAAKPTHRTVGWGHRWSLQEPYGASWEYRGMTRCHQWFTGWQSHLPQLLEVNLNLLLTFQCLHHAEREIDRHASEYFLGMDNDNPLPHTPIKRWPQEAERTPRFPGHFSSDPSLLCTINWLSDAYLNSIAKQNKASIKQKPDPEQ